MTDDDVLARISAHAELLESYYRIAEKIAEGLRKSLPWSYQVTVDFIEDHLAYRIQTVSGNRTYTYEALDSEVAALTRVGSYPAWLSAQVKTITNEMRALPGSVWNDADNKPYVSQSPSEGGWYEAKGHRGDPLTARVRSAAVDEDGFQAALESVRRELDTDARPNT